MKLLFTSAGRRVELIQRFQEASQKLKLELEIHGADISETAPALMFCDRKHLVPRIKDPAYIPELLKICQSDHIDLVIPTIDTDLLLLAENKSLFHQIGSKVLVSNPDMIALCRDNPKSRRPDFITA